MHVAFSLVLCIGQSVFKHYLTCYSPSVGRDNFLALEADKALSIMVRCVSEARSINSLTALSSHKSNFVKAKVASHLVEILEGGSARAVLLNNWAVTEKLFK